LRFEERQIDIDKKKLGPKFRKDAKTVEEAIEALTQTQREAFSTLLDKDGAFTLQVSSLPEGKVQLDKSMVEIVKRARVENTREYIPNVIEPSFKSMCSGIVQVMQLAG
jgi:glycyl-tRNA synthetase